ncbi:ABC transporter ATP-binding protein [Oceanotoga sp. DSM 15011]|uniref:ABC transporter ATP-binding protein n=1 Tax=Oceanotoga sp. DSM 15011 TaxID=2984951 RepID=UPI0021F4EA3A|nr:ABC transporter ATP-binding protein [Oceanotoga sp. DSM 15011]UYP01267.1 ABC transporter ATP-binding protein [Oceanotoga sp. DSM 15011]
MSEDKIIIKNLNKFYGKKQALKGINLSIEKGMFGLLGRNGAGKTTLMRIIASTLTYTNGDIDVCGINIKNVKQIRKNIGYLPQDFSIYPSMKVYESLEYLGCLSKISTKILNKRIEYMLEKVNLIEEKNMKIKALSGGMKRRLGIAQALLHEPKILIVDEPTAGLDPEERVRFRNLLSEVSTDRIVILSTHIVGDIEATCENIGILNEGSLLYNGKVDDLIEKANNKVYKITTNKNELPILKKKYKITGMHTSGDKVIVRFISESLVTDAELCTPNIEDAYMFYLDKITSGNGVEV